VTPFYGTRGFLFRMDAGAPTERYTGRMRSVVDELREETRRQIADLSPVARIDLALALGDADLARLCDARQISVEAARAIIARSRRAGRRLSRCHDE
jgi:hypothetical protein